MDEMIQPFGFGVNNQTVENDSFFLSRIANRCSVVINGGMFAEKIRTLLKSKGWSQGELASAIGTRQQVVSRWLDRNTPPKAKYLAKLAEVLEVSVDYLILDSAEKPAVGENLDQDERTVLTTFRALKLHVEEAVRRLHGTAAGMPKVVPEPGTSVEDLDAEQRRAVNGEMPKKPKPKGIG